MLPWKAMARRERSRRWEAEATTELWRGYYRQKDALLSEVLDAQSREVWRLTRHHKASENTWIQDYPGWRDGVAAMALAVSWAVLHEGTRLHAHLDPRDHDGVTMHLGDLADPEQYTIRLVRAIREEPSGKDLVQGLQFQAGDAPDDPARQRDL